MLLNQKTMCALLDVLCSERPTYERAAAAAGVGVRTLFTWLKLSKDDEKAGIPPNESKFGVSWPPDSGAPPDYLHNAVMLARRLFLLLADGHARAALFGQERVVIENGRVQYEIDPLAVAQGFKDAQEAAIMGWPDWPFAHDERGARIPLKVLDPPPASARIHLLRSLLPNTFNPANNETILASHQHEVRGVLEVAPGGRMKIQNATGEQPAALEEPPELTKPAAGNPAINRNSPMRKSFEQFLAERRANPPAPLSPEVARAHENVLRSARASDPADDKPLPEVSPAPDLAAHPRAYQAPAPAAPPKPAPSYARPATAHTTADGSSHGPGRVLPNGYKPNGG